LCEILKEAGVKIDGIGTSIITIKGTAGEPIEFKDIEIIPDRIEAGTYLCGRCNYKLINHNKEGKP